MAKDAFGTNVNRPHAGGMKPPPEGYMKGDTGKPGGAPTGATPMLGGRMVGGAPGPIGKPSKKPTATSW